MDGLPTLQPKNKPRHVSDAADDWILSARVKYRHHVVPLNSQVIPQQLHDEVVAPLAALASGDVEEALSACAGLAFLECWWWLSMRVGAYNSVGLVPAA